MKVPLPAKWLLFTIALFQLLSLKVDCQVLPSIRDPLSSAESSADAITATKTATTTTVAATTTEVASSVVTTTAVTTTNPPPASSVPTTTTTVSTLQPSIPASSSAVPSSTTTTTTIAASSSVQPSSSSVQPSSSSRISTTSSATSSSGSLTNSRSSTTSAVPSATPSKANEPSSNTTPTIVGSVVGGVVGLALIGGLIAFISRRGGCTKKRGRNNKSGFEDYGLGDFPQHRNPAPTVPAMATANNPVSPTLPRLNEQGNYYNDDYNHYGYRQDDYGMQPSPQGGYYYPQGHHQQQGYYEDGGYYYDNNSGMAPNTAYSSPPHAQQPYNSQDYAIANNMEHSPAHQQPQNLYKPDDVASPVGTTGGVQQK
ncbi:hypothetical protein G6F37_008928 [Rhizopus arrhizus]|nr:hypothetical protein G6F38_002700 [Rhizopus arrhizus]KAG1155010.1 hypothetical protein G6F37_008928 [Rhizopus arrhizus]